MTYQGDCIESIKRIEAMVRGKIPCAPVLRIVTACDYTGCDLSLPSIKKCPDCELYFCKLHINKHWLEEHSTGDAKRDCNFGITR